MVTSCKSDHPKPIHSNDFFFFSNRSTPNGSSLLHWYSVFKWEKNRTLTKNETICHVQNVLWPCVDRKEVRQLYCIYLKISIWISNLLKWIFCWSKFVMRALTLRSNGTNFKWIEKNVMSNHKSIKCPHLYLSIARTHTVSLKRCRINVNDSQVVYFETIHILHILGRVCIIYYSRYTIFIQYISRTTVWMTVGSVCSGFMWNYIRTHARTHTQPHSRTNT